MARTGGSGGGTPRPGEKPDCVIFLAQKDESVALLKQEERFHCDPGMEWARKSLITFDPIARAHVIAGRRCAHIAVRGVLRAGRRARDRARPEGRPRVRKIRAAHQRLTTRRPDDRTVETGPTSVIHLRIRPQEGGIAFSPKLNQDSLGTRFLTN